ncbi:MAG: ComEC/Rec2 family competence protein, partial [Eubacteriaceae bacterium]
MKQKKTLYVVVAVLLAAVLLLSGCSSSGSSGETAAAEDEAVITYLDTGQSNATLIQTGSGQNILIDTGDATTRKELIADLKGLGVQTIDLLVITHWHLDHAGGGKQVVENFDVKEAWVSDNVNTNATTTKTLQALDDKNVTTETPKAGETRTFGDCVFTVVGPVKSYDDQNNSSIVIRMTHGENGKFLFPGDMEEKAAEDMVASGVDLSTDVLLAAHHGSRDGSCEAFLNALGPDFKTAVI